MPSYDISTYTGLSNSIQAYTEVDETSFLGNIPTFIQNTERLVNNRVQLPAFKKAVVLVTTPTNPYLTLPDDFLAPFSIAAINGSERFSFLLNKDINYIRECFPYPAAMGLPTTYALYGPYQLLLGPTPNGFFSVEIQYFAYPESIVTAGSTWLSINYPNVLLWGALTEAYIYLKGETDLVQMYQAKFEEAMAPLKQLGDAKDKTDDYRAPQAREIVT